MELTNVTSIQLKTTYVDRPEIQEVFADSVKMVSFNDNILRVELCVSRMDEPKPPAAPTSRQYPSARLALTPTATLQLYSNLSSIVAALEKQGVVHRTATPPPAAPPKH